MLFVGDSSCPVWAAPQQKRQEALPLAARQPPAGGRVRRRSRVARLGETGSDVSMIRRNLLQSIKIMMLLLLWFNDFKQLARGEFWRTPWAFGRDLEALVDEVRKRKTNNARVVLPAYPVAVAGIAEPLKSCVGVVASAWDAQKKSLAEKGAATFR